MTEQRSCRKCGASFEVPYPSSTRVHCDQHRRATRSDKGVRKIEYVSVMCKCGTEFEVPPSRLTLSKTPHCSRECYKRFEAAGEYAPQLGPGMYGPRNGGRFINAQGYAVIYLPRDQWPEGWDRAQILEHRHVMRQMIGRDLLPGENVHHKNGIRDDNRPENLELWVERQPKGQSVKDALEWAREIIARYEPIAPRLF